MVKKQPPSEHPTEYPTSTGRATAKKKAATSKKADTKKTAPMWRFRLDPLVMKAGVGVIILLVVFFITQPSMVDKAAHTLGLEAGPNTHGGTMNGSATLSTIFTPEVLYWSEEIKRWALERGVNPNILATIMQIESCGDPYVSSYVGAQGLFQVMPFHFDPGENQLNPDSNVRNGIDHLVECLQLSNYDVGVSFVCYNGGASVIYMSQNEWYEETRNYYVFGTGIYNDAISGVQDSPAVQRWLDAGGQGLCVQARETQVLLQP